MEFNVGKKGNKCKKGVFQSIGGIKCKDQNKWFDLGRREGGLQSLQKRRNKDRVVESDPISACDALFHLIFQ